MKIQLPSIYRVLGGGGLFAGGLILLTVLLFPQPDFVTFVRIHQDGMYVLGLFYFGLFVFVLGGLTSMYGRIGFQFDHQQMVVLFGKRVWLTIEHERITAVRYRQNWLQIKWQGRGAWLSYWLALPAREPQLLNAYRRWLPILQQEMARLQQEIPEEITLRLKASFAGVWLVLTPLFQVVGWGGMFAYFSGNLEIDGWGDWLVSSTAMFIFISLGTVFTYLILWQTGWHYTVTAQGICVRYGVRRKVWQTVGFSPKITRSHRIYTYKGIPQRIEQVVIVLPNSEKLTLESNELAYQKHLPPSADFDLLAHHLHQLYQS